MGYWFIKKATWSSSAEIKSNAASLKKFYHFLFEIGEIEKEEFNNLKADIKEGMPEWLETMRRYEDFIDNMG